MFDKAKKVLGFTDFDNKDMEQMNTIHNLFKQHIGTTTLPFELEFDPKNDRRAAHHPNEHDFHANRWDIGAGFMGHIAHETVTDICAYQTDRDQRPIGGGYKPDPVNLVLEYLKRWLTEILGEIQPNEDNLKIILAHGRFVEALEHSGIFEPGCLSDTTMAETLMRVRRHFNEEIIPRVQAEISNASAREHMQKFVEHSKKLIGQFVPFLVYMLRERQAPTNLTLRNLRYPDKPPMHQVTDSLSGQCVVKLIRSEPFTRLLPDEVAKYSYTYGMQVGSSLKNNPFTNENQELIVPKDISVNAKVKNIIEFAAHAKSGFDPYFTKDKGLTITAFLQLHANIFRYTELVNLFHRLYLLAGQGGDLLVYGTLRPVVIQILKCAESLLERTEVLFKTVSHQAETYNDSLITDNKKSEWLMNYQFVKFYHRHISEEFARLISDVSRIRAIVDGFNLPDALKEANDEVQLLCSKAQSFSNELAKALGEPTLKFNLPTIPTIPEMGIVPPLPSTSSSRTGNSDIEESQRIMIDLANFNLTDKAEDIPADLLRLNSSIKIAELQKNNFSIVGLYKFLDNVRFHPNITTINLWRNKIGDEGISALSAAIFDSNIQELVLNENGITAKGLRLFSVCLPANKHLTFLDLGYQGKHFGDKGLNYLLLGLEHQFILTNLRIGGNGISPIGAKNFLNFLKKHKEVTSVDFDGNDVSEEIKQGIYRQVERNKIHSLRSAGPSVAPVASFFPAQAATSKEQPSPAAASSSNFWG